MSMNIKRKIEKGFPPGSALVSIVIFINFSIEKKKQQIIICLKKLAVFA